MEDKMPMNFFRLKELSEKNQLSLEHTEKELFHNIFLYLLYNKLKRYTKLLAFKGGTCLYKCYGLPRFSEDLDFDIIGGKLSNKQVGLLFTKHLMNSLREAFGYGNIVFRTKENPNGLNIHVDIRGSAFSQTHRDCHIKFDLSARRKLIYNVKEVRYDASLFLQDYNLPEQIINLSAVDPREIFAEKIVAILDKNFIFGQRDEARDLFDIYILLLMNHSCKFEDIKNKLPQDKKEVFTLDHFSDSIYRTAKSNEWEIMLNQLIIEPKLKELGLSLTDLAFSKVSQFVIHKIKYFYFSK